MSISKTERENLEKIRYCKRIEALSKIKENVKKHIKHIEALSKRIREKAKERNIDLSKIPIVLK